MVNLQICLCMFQVIIELTVLLKSACVQLHAVSDALLFGVLSFGVENCLGVKNVSFIGNLISINLFRFGP